MLKEGVGKVIISGWVIGILIIMFWLCSIMVRKLLGGEMVYVKKVLLCIYLFKCNVWYLKNELVKV